MPQSYKHLEVPINFLDYVKNKKVSSRSYFQYFLARVTKMFQYKNLPDTIPHEILERYLMLNGVACITEVDGKLYVFYGNAGGPQDEYYRPSQFIISNPHLRVGSEGTKGFSANIQIFGEDVPQSNGEPVHQKGVLLRNDTEWLGLAPMIARYSTLMAENVLTLRTADVMLRITALITAQSDKELFSANEYLKNIENGELSTVGESAFFDGVNLQSPPSNNGSYLTQFIEYQQYLKGSFFNEIGLSANYNMKREAIGKGESTLDQDALLPLCDNMLLCRREDLSKVNDMYGTNIEVEYSSVWLQNAIESLHLLSGSSPAAGQLAQGGVNNGPADAEQEQTETEQEEPEQAETVEEHAETVEEQAETVEEQAETVEEQAETVEEQAETEPEQSISEINDISSDNPITEIYENLKESACQQADLPEQNIEEGGESDDAGEAAEDKGDNPED